MSRLGRFGIAAAVGVGAWLRFAAAQHGYAPDELANITEKGVWAIIVDPESGVNPPLLRLLVNAPFNSAGSLVWGRILVWLCGVLAIPAVGALGRRVGGEPAGVVAAWIWALHLDAVRMSGQIRSYSPFVLVAALHLLAVLRWSDDPKRTRAVWVTALLLPQLHYFGVPLLLGVALAAAAGPGGALPRGLWRWYVPAAVALTPLALLILGQREARVAMKGPLRDTLLLMGSLDLQGPSGLSGAWFGAAGLRPDLQDHALQATITAALLLSHLLRPAPWTTAARVLTGALLGVLAGVLGFSTVQYVRSPVALYVGVAAVPLIAAWVGRVSGRPAKVGVALLIGGALGPALSRGLADLRGAWPEDAIVEVVASWRSYDAVRRDRPVFFTPQHALTGAYVALAHRHLMSAPERGAGACADDIRCFLWDGVTFRAWTEGPVPDGLVVAVEDVDPRLRSTCAVVAERPFAAVFDCAGP